MNAAINGKKLLKNLAIPLAGGTLVGLLTKNGVQIFNETAKKPVFMPPGWLFPVAWTILYTLMGIAAYQIDDAENTPEKNRALLLYYVQLAMNLLWSFLFFGGRFYLAALVWLLAMLALIIATIVKFWKIKPKSGALLLPYAAWVTFAGVLNAAVWMLNR